MHSKSYAVCVPTIPAFCRCCIVLCCSQTAPQCAWQLQFAAMGCSRKQQPCALWYSWRVLSVTVLCATGVTATAQKQAVIGRCGNCQYSERLGILLGASCGCGCGCGCFLSSVWGTVHCGVLCVWTSLSPGPAQAGGSRHCVRCVDRPLAFVPSAPGRRCSGRCSTRACPSTSQQAPGALFRVLCLS
jgi:hypothetical protein